MTADKNEHYDVSIVGVGVGANYGSVLTYYSLYKTIEDFGNKVLMVSKIGASANDPEIRNTHAMEFARKHYNLSKIYSQQNVSDLNQLSDTFVIGSDQVWNYGIAQNFARAFYLDFAADDKRKLSYAASFGHAKDFAPADQIPEISSLMRRFNAISVREDTGVKIARDVYQVPAKQVAEPIFLSDLSRYLDLAKQSKRDVSGPYLLAYILDPTPEKKAAIEHLAGKLGLKVRVMLDAWPHLVEQNKAKMDMPDAVEDDIDTYDFLKLYANASYVLSDSFHGTSFALKFQKPFASIGNLRRGITRFDSMFRLIGHRDRFTLNAEEIITRDKDFLAPLDYSGINATLDSHVRESKAWLEAALKKPVHDTVQAIEPTPAEAEPARRRLMRAPRKAARLVKHRLMKQSFRLDAPRFSANNDAWKVTAASGSTKLRVASPGQAERGNFVWTDLPAALREGASYTLEIDWSFVTTGQSIAIHLRNPETGKFRVVGKVAAGASNKVRHADKISFTVSEAGLSQIMFGALHFSGPDGGADITRITVESASSAPLASHDEAVSFSHRVARRLRREVRTRTARLRAPKARGGKDAPPARKGGLQNIGDSKATPSGPLAVPDHTPNRAQRITNVLSDPKVQEWKREISERIPDLTFYVGRELKEYTNNKVGGPADILAFPKTIDEVQHLILLASERGIALTVLGRGSNVLVRDGGIRGIVILTTDLKYFKLEAGAFTAGAGSSLIEAAFHLLDNGRSGLEWAAGIPGTVGGAVYMNAGTYTSDVRSNLRSATVIDRDGHVFTLSNDEINWGVRYTTFQDRKDWIVLDATFNTKDGVNIEMAKKMIGTVQARENSMPMESPNHGSTFKWYRAPRLIKQAGLVGTRIGGAKISEKQPGFIINVKQATASDYEALINYIIAKVYEFCGFMLEPEVEIIGELPHRYKRYPKGDQVGRLE